MKSTLVIALLLLVGCSGGGSSQGPSGPGTVSLPHALDSGAVRIDLPWKPYLHRRVPIPMTLTQGVRDTILVEDYIFVVPACTLKVRSRRSPAVSYQYSWKDLRVALLYGETIRDSSAWAGNGFAFHLGERNGYAGQAAMASTGDEAYGACLKCPAADEGLQVSLSEAMKTLRHAEP